MFLNVPRIKPKYYTLLYEWRFHWWIYREKDIHYYGIESKKGLFRYKSYIPLIYCKKNKSFFCFFLK